MQHHTSSPCEKSTHDARRRKILRALLLTRTVYTVVRGERGELRIVPAVSVPRSWSA